MKKKDNIPLLLKIVRWIYPKLERFAPALAYRYFVRLFFTPLRYPVPEKERKAEKYADWFTIEIASKKVQCYRWGKGPAVLVVHGWAGRATQFRRFIQPLNRAGYSVVGFDGPAHGHSEGKHTEIREFEECLMKIYAKSGPPAAILAHSFGGGAVLYAAMNGLPVTKLVNIATPTIGDEIISTYLKAINGSAKTGDFFKKYIPKTFGKSFDQFTSTYFVQHLPRPINLLLIHDDQDKEVDIRQAEELQKLYPQARLLKTSGLGHTRILKDDGVISACVTFIQQGTST